MAVTLHVSDPALALLRPVFIALEGDCEAWLDEEIVQRLLIRGAMDYAKQTGRSWDEVSALASDLRVAFEEG